MYCTRYYGLPADLVVYSRNGCHQSLIETLDGGLVMTAGAAGGDARNTKGWQPLGPERGAHPRHASGAAQVDLLSTF